jgi:SepF-like predicted cell division protein (DUF552 family)
MKQKKRNQGSEKKKRRKLYEKYGHFIGCETRDIPEKHRAAAGGLRCFRRVTQRDDHGNKIKNSEKKRCGRACSKGSLYCKFHGGGNSKALVHGKRTTATLEKYKGVHTHSMQDYMTSFINDPKILDMKAELVMVRSVLHNYMANIAEGETKPKNPKKKLRMIQQVLNSDDMGDIDKLLTIKEITDSIRALDDGTVIDRVNRCVETVGKTIDRIQKYESKDQFMLTPEGLKIMLRGFLDVLKTSVSNEEELRNIQQQLADISVKTGGDLTKYHEISDGEFTMVKDGKA